MKPEDCQCVHAYFGCDFEGRVAAMTPVVDAAVAYIEANEMHDDRPTLLTARLIRQKYDALRAAVREYEEGKK